ncbi:hypothetical protein BD560DRAFT_409758 [Blakeslea trispora]|nr:hypothetical protein BD560DRAFT_409758 [Blakeslea trispora]
MNTRFCYENGQVTPFHLKTLTSVREYCEKQEDAQLSPKEDIEKLDFDMEEAIAVVKNQIKIYHRYSNEHLIPT